MDHSAEIRRLKRKLDRLTRSYALLKDRYRASFNNAADPIIVIDSQGNIVDINNTFVYETGYTRKDVNGRNIFTDGIVTPDSAVKISGIIEKYGTTKERPIFEISGVHRNGEVIPYELRAHISQTITGVPVFYAILRNIKDRKLTETALRDSEDRFRTIVESAPSLLMITDDRGKVVYISPNSRKITGFTETELKRGKYSWVDPRDRQKYLAKIYSRQKCHNFTYRAVKKQGESWFASTSFVPVKGTGRRFQGLVIQTVDVTRLKVAEQAQKQSVKLFKSIFDSSPLGMFIYEMNDAGELILTNTNPAADSILGIECRKLIGKTIGDAFPKLKETEIPQKYVEIATRGISWHTSQFEYQEERVTGAFEIDAFQISTGRMVVIFSDKTKTRQAETALRESEERFRSVLENSPAGICLVDENAVIIYANQTLAKIFNITREHLLNTNIQKLLPAEKSRFITERLMKRQKGEDLPEKYEIELMKGSGEKILVEINSSVVTSSRGKKITIAQLLDVTHQRRLEEQLKQAEKMRAVGQLAGGIAHDFNNILTIINGYSEIALRHVLESDAVHMHLNEILKAGQKAEKFTRQLLGFSRKQLVQLKVVHVETIVNDLTKMLQRLIGEDIILESVTGDNVSPVKADPGQLEQILVNLVVNARDALDERSDTGAEKKIMISIEDVHLHDIFVRANPGSTVGPHVRLSVSDNGIGMDRDVRNRIFEPFFSTKGRDRGTGLGMATVYGIVKQNNGSIYVSSLPGEGSTVEIFWPACREEISTGEDADRQAQVIRGKGTILLVEDDHDVRELIFNSLSTMGYHVLQAGDGNEALAIVKNNHTPIDLLLTDIIMPNMGGRELAEEVRKLMPGLKILFTSGYSDNKIGQDGVLDGDLNFIQKPYTLQLLSAKVKSLIDG